MGLSSGDGENVHWPLNEGRLAGLAMGSGIGLKGLTATVTPASSATDDSIAGGWKELDLIVQYYHYKENLLYGMMIISILYTIV